jgi:predicted ATPase with chaperone activity
MLETDRVFAFPPKVMLVLANVRCPCGYYGDPVNESTCSQRTIAR